MSKSKKLIDNRDFNLAYEKLFMPEAYSTDGNYTLDRAFAISNEKLNDVFKAFDLSNKKVLTVGSSGDQALNAILSGSNDITIIDANIFARPFIEYKFAVIKTYDFETFSDIFIKNDFFDSKVYSKISHLLSKNVQIFWDSLMIDISNNSYEDTFTKKSLKEKMLFIDHRDRYSAFYKDEIIYKKLQKLLNDSDMNINFINAEFQEFPKILKSKYDLIYLSNIFDYYKNNESLFNRIIDKLYKNNLNNEGIIVTNYSFNKKIYESPNQIGNYPIKHIQVSRFYEGTNNNDTVWIIQKEKDNIKKPRIL